MKLSQLSLADYNQLDSIPVINQDLSATDFTPVANTYYKHTGTTTASYTNGMIYYYNSTGYVALDGSAVGLATVAKTGSYSDLQNIPTDIAKIGNLSNPNLLINPNFAINQRGKTSYTGTEYAVDRWKNSYGTLELQSNGEIKHTSLSTWQGVAQYIENPSRLAGKTVTISAMGRGDGATAFRIYLYYQIGNNAKVTVCTAQTTATTNTIISASGTLPEDITDNDKLYFMLYNATANTSFYCKWAKLEIGSVATEFSPPSIAEELQKCYRYFIKLQTAIMPAYSTGSTSARYSICLPTNMMTTPTINFSSGNGYIMYNGKSHAVTANTVFIMTGNIITITATTTELSGNNSCSFTTGTDVVMSLDAEF